MSDALILGLVRTVQRELDRRDPRERARKVRQDMMRRGLKHCPWAGYGYRWCRGRRVRDDREVEQIGRIVAMHHEEGVPLYRIAVTFMYERVKTRAGKEWSYDRVCRAYWAAVRGEVPGARGGWGRADQTTSA